MKVYRGIVKGNTILLEEKPDLPDECRALVEIKPVDEARDQEIARKHIALLKKGPLDVAVRYEATRAASLDIGAKLGSAKNLCGRQRRARS